MELEINHVEFLTKGQYKMVDNSEIKHFFSIIKPYRQDFLIHPKEEDGKIMAQHFAYLQTLLATGKLFLAGPTLIEKDPFGVLIFETNSISEAKELLENDPSIKAGIQLIHDLRPMRVSLYKK